MTRFVDFHCHLDLYDDHRRAVRECEAKEIYTLSVTTTPRAWPQNRDFTRGTRYVRAGLGLHPQLAQEREDEMAIWESFAGEARYIGEVGLDASRQHRSSLAAQRRAFRRIVACCEEQGGKILSVHSVRSAGMVLDELEDLLARQRGKVILHWFTGTQSELERGVELGCMFSINLTMLRSRRGRQVARVLPSDVLLTETDGPFATIRQRPAFPTDVSEAVAEIADIRGEEIGYMTDVIWSNARRFLGSEGE